MTNDRFRQREPIDKADAIARILETSTVHEAKEVAHKTPAQLAADRERVKQHDVLFGIRPGDPFSPEGLRKLGPRYSVGDPAGRDD